MGPQEPTPAPYTPPSEVPVVPPVPVQPMQMQPNQPVAQQYQASPQYPPVQPQSNFQQFPSGPAGYMAPPQPSKSKKGLFIGLGVGGGLLVVVTVLTLVFMTSFGITKKDYQDADMKAEEMASKGLESSSDFIMITYVSTYGNQFDFDEVQENFDTFKKLFDEVKSMKALNDSEIKAAFSEYEKDAGEFIKFAESYLSSAKKVIVSMNKCISDGVSSSTTSSSVSSLGSAVASCKAAMSDGKMVTDPDLKKLAEAYYNFTIELESIISQASVFSSNNYSAAAALRNKLYDAEDALFATFKDVNSSIKKRYEAADITANSHSKLEEIMIKKAL